MNESPEEESEFDFSAGETFARPLIFEGDPAKCPEGFEVVTLSIDGKIDSDLNWSGARESAGRAVEAGYGLLWKMDLGLFHRLSRPLADRMQFLSLSLSLKQFRDTLWEEFKDRTAGISIYEGEGDFAKGFSLDEELKVQFKNLLSSNGIESASGDLTEFMQSPTGKYYLSLFCRDLHFEYLGLLGMHLPDTLPLYLHLDGGSLSESLPSQLACLNPESLGRFTPILKNSPFLFDAVGREIPRVRGYSGMVLRSLPETCDETIGVCIPPSSVYSRIPYEELADAMTALQRKNSSYKMISENQLTARWDGLDILIYSPKGLTSAGKRKLLGFCAAGGEVISTAELSGFGQERSFADLIKKL